MTRLSWLLAVTLVLAAPVVPAALAQAAEPAQGDTRHGQREGRLQQQLGLTDQQAQAIREIHARQSQTWKTHSQTLRQAQAELRRLVLSEADQASVQAKQEEVQRLLGETVQMRVNTLKEMTSILTPEQREKYAATAEQGRRSRHHHRRQPS
jgi:Spy/CpxP family protein refolding chaperone